MLQDAAISLFLDALNGNTILYIAKIVLIMTVLFTVSVFSRLCSMKRFIVKFCSKPS